MSEGGRTKPEVASGPCIAVARSAARPDHVALAVQALDAVNAVTRARRRVRSLCHAAGRLAPVPQSVRRAPLRRRVRSGAAGARVPGAAAVHVA